MITNDADLTDYPFDSTNVLSPTFTVTVQAVSPELELPLGSRKKGFVSSLGPPKLIPTDTRGDVNIRHPFIKGTKRQKNLRFDSNAFIEAWRQKQTHQKEICEQLSRPKVYPQSPAMNVSAIPPTKYHEVSNQFESIARLSRPRSFATVFETSNRLFVEHPRPAQHPSLKVERDARRLLHVKLEPVSRAPNVYLAEQSIKPICNESAGSTNINWLADRTIRFSDRILRLIETLMSSRSEIEEWCIRIVFGIIQSVVSRRLGYKAHSFISEACPRLAEALSELTSYFPSEMCLVKLGTLHQGLLQVCKGLT